MYVLIAEDGSLSLEDADEFKSFSVVEMPDAPQQGKASAALSQIAEKADEDHYWIDADKVIQISSKSDDAEWVNGFWEMLNKVEPYGYYDTHTQRVKAHVEIRA